MIREAISKIAKGIGLSADEMEQVMREIVDGVAKESQVAALLMGLTMKGENPEEIIGALKVIKEKAKKVEIPCSPLMDIVGTGGDGGKTFNVSTVSAFVLAGGGVKVAKHGNRALSSLCGSADFLESLGAKITGEESHIKRLIDSTGFAFLFAPFFHPALKNVQKTRQEMGVRTIFNLLGPLANPASPTHMVLGVAQPEICETYVEVLLKTKVQRAAVVHGLDGLDEISVIGETRVYEIDTGRVKRYTISPEDFGIKRAKEEEIKGGDRKDNVRIAKEIMEGKERGAKRDIVLMNAGFGFYIAGRKKSIEEGIDYAREIIDSKQALKVVKEYVAESLRCS
jgi:anthranilate phosphoribosyltransferase